MNITEKAILSVDYERYMPVALLGEPYRGKVRLVYKIPSSESEDYPLGLLLIVATDNISTHDVVHLKPIAFKGYALTAFSVLGFVDVLGDEVPHHLVAHGREIYDYLPQSTIDGTYPEDLHFRALVCKNLLMEPYEFVWRNYLCGSLHKKYYIKGEDPHELLLPDGLPLMHKFTDLTFTPTTKSEKDYPVSCRDVANSHGVFVNTSLKAWQCFEKFFASRGLELVDGKIEMGCSASKHSIRPTVGDEPPITPDCIRLALPGDIKEGEEPEWIGKENVRQLVEDVWARNEKPNSPIKIPEETALGISRECYRKPFDLISGMSLEEYWSKRGFD